MKKQSYTAYMLCVALMAMLFACDQNARKMEVPTYLQDVENIVGVTNGFHVRHNDVDISTITVAGNKALHLAFHDQLLRPYAADIFLENDALEKVGLESGKYEIVFLKSVLIVNDPVAHRKVHFIVNNQDLAPVRKAIPAAYLEGNGFNAIGIAVYGDHKASRLAGDGSSDLKDDCATSGGTGSVQCSNACCSITCSSGYYASCGKSCNCSRNP
ncbi:hypothetical protein [Dyadobacter sandarakinus]|uniref:Uncharacterized protein n=1 Tax=Dyadobacter sandarakinus TaxID=2747268 RepID=A0ABX7I3J8_9BACT|nr:hypothetical protein [Dyadobacter sandarakinus]QRR00404.1 hypothetical protein HWI92_05520 [Dyadobacter sandarakinus]